MPAVTPACSGRAGKKRSACKSSVRKQLAKRTAIECLGRAGLKKLARRAGVYRMSAACLDPNGRDTIPHALTGFVRAVVGKAVVLSEYARRHTVIPNDIAYALKQMGITLYKPGCDWTYAKYTSRYVYNRITRKEYEPDQLASALQRAAERQAQRQAASQAASAQAAAEEAARDGAAAAAVAVAVGAAGAAAGDEAGSQVASVQVAPPAAAAVEAAAAGPAVQQAAAAAAAVEEEEQQQQQQGAAAAMEVDDAEQQQEEGQVEEEEGAQHQDEQQQQQGELDAQLVTPGRDTVLPVAASARKPVGAADEAEPAPTQGQGLQQSQQQQQGASPPGVPTPSVGEMSRERFLEVRGWVAKQLMGPLSMDGSGSIAKDDLVRVVLARHTCFESEVEGVLGVLEEEESIMLEADRIYLCN